MKKLLVLLFLLNSILFSSDYVLVSTPIYTNIYSVTNKIPEIGIVHLKWDIVKQKTKRINNFHQNKLITSNIQATNKDYAHSGFDKGHFSASNADWDNNKSNMAYTFAFTNMTPQYPKTNRVSYRKVEGYGRSLVEKYQDIFVINIAVLGTHYMKGHINIPSEYIKIFIHGNSKECYRIPNDNKVYTLEKMKIDCNSIRINNL